MKYIKENLVMSMGIFLPIALMLIFFVSTQLPKSEPPPQYDLMFVTSQYYYDRDNDGYYMKYDFIDGKLRARAIARDDDDKNRYRGERLYRYDAENQIVSEVKPAVRETAPGSREYIVGFSAFDQDNLKLDISDVSPDGYTVRDARRGSRGLFNEIFWSGSRNRNMLILSKNRSHYKVDMPSGYYSYSNAGKEKAWVISE